jgi:hypothetical protein
MATYIKNLDNELLNATLTINALKLILIHKKICTEEELNSIIQSQLVAYKLSDEQVTYSVKWS